MSEIFELSDRAVDLVADIDPLMATYMGVAGRDHRWPDLSPAGMAARRELWVSLLAQAESIEPGSEPEELAKRVLIDDGKEAIRRYDSGDHLRDLNNIESPFQLIKDVFDLMARDTLDEWARIVVRLETIGAPVEGYRETLAAGLDSGHAVSRRQILAVIEEGRLTASDGSPLIQLSGALADSGLGDDGLRTRLDQAIDIGRAEYGDLTDWLESTYLPAAPDRDPCGRERYREEARKHLGMDIDIDETYSWGWREVSRLRRRIAEVCTEIDPSVTVDELVADLSTNPNHGAADVDSFIATMQEVQDRAVEQLAGTHFDVPDQVRHVDVKPSPPGGALAPYYSVPSEDFSRPGTVWYPLGSRTFFPLWDEMTTAYHEGFPGHHLQMGIQISLGEQLSRYHRLYVWNPGSGEGWALYAEHLMGELGFHSKPEYELGMLAAQMVRACRVVIDIGWHCELPIPDDSLFHPGEPWSWELAVEMLVDEALQSPERAISEATRYQGWPAQAISYKVGERVILDLREQLALEADFDLRDFHSRVLNVGSVGLDLLGELVMKDEPRARQA